MDYRFLTFICGFCLLCGCAARSHEQDVSVSVDAAEAYQTSVRQYDELSQIRHAKYEEEKKAEAAELNARFDKVRADVKPRIDAAKEQQKKAEEQLYQQEQGVLDNAQLLIEQANLRELEKQAFGEKK
jgi:outer membrane murein-binding lipoprotein Lpp